MHVLNLQESGSTDSLLYGRLIHDKMPYTRSEMAKACMVHKKQGEHADMIKTEDTQRVESCLLDSQFAA